MGSRGGDAPNNLKQRRLATLFLRVPSIDWPRVAIGEKTEFRTMPREGSRVLTTYLPTPVVAYATANGPLREMVHKLMVLEERRYEPIFAISDDPEAIRREGFESYDHFRRYWRARQKGVYRPMQRVWVWRVRPWDDREDHVRLSVAMLEHLYEDYL